ncbi:MAG TPA: hypothetical protein EYN89_13555, partial [Flavobacteriales bacterium]|nr:hypothetical protein [Flavobacteriales bacterium]
MSSRTLSTSFNNSTKLINWLLPIGIFIVSATIRWFSLTQTNYANGWDAYYYLIQVRSLFETGQMHSADLSLIYPLLVLAKSVTGNYVVAYKLTAALLSGLFSFGLYQLAISWTKSHRIAVILALISLFSPQLTYFAAQYPKNLLGMVLFMGFLVSLSARKHYYPIFLLVLNYFGHRLTFGLSGIVGIIYFLNKQFSRKTLFAIVGGGLFLLGIGFVLPGVL